jgi:hypothetical protein
MSKKISELTNLNDISSVPGNLLIPISNTASSVTNSVKVDTLRNYISIHANSAYNTSNAAFNKANNALANTTGTLGIGYRQGSGGYVTQLTSRTTPVTLNAVTGRILLFNVIVPAEYSDTFIFNNSYITANDLLYIAHISNGTMSLYDITATPQNGSAIITVRNNSNDPSPPEQPLLGFMLFKSAIA